MVVTRSLLCVGESVVTLNAARNKMTVKFGFKVAIRETDHVYLGRVAIHGISGSRRHPQRQANNSRNKGISITNQLASTNQSRFVRVVDVGVSGCPCVSTSALDGRPVASMPSVVEPICQDLRDNPQLVWHHLSGSASIACNIPLPLSASSVLNALSIYGHH